MKRGILFISLFLVCSQAFAADTVLIAHTTSNTFSATTNYVFPVGSTVPDTTESNVQHKFYLAGTLSKFRLNVSSNSRNANTTFNVQVNAAPGNQTVTVTASTSGWFADAVNTDAIAANDLVAYKYTTAGSSGGLVVNNFNSKFAATTNTVQEHGLSDNLGFGLTYNTSNARRYQALSGSWSTHDTTEANWRHYFHATGTLQRMRVYISSNARTTTTTFGSRKNTADGALAVTVTAGSTGWFEDTSNSDAVTLADLMCAYILGGVETNAIVYDAIDSQFVTADETQEIFNNINSTFNGLSTVYFGLVGTGGTNSTDGTFVSKAPFAFTASRLSLYLSANAATSGNTLLYLRKDGSDTALSLTIAFGATGWFHDTTNSVQVAENALIQYKYVGSIGGTTSGRLVGFKVSAPSVAARRIFLVT